MVRLLRVLLPSLVVFVVLLQVMIAWLNPLRVLSNLPQLGNIVISGSKIKMQTPKLAGYTRDGRAYNMTADSAAQDITQPTMIELAGVRGKMETADKEPMNVTARSGLYDSKNNLMTLHDDIVVTGSTFVAYLVEATIDVNKGTLASKRPVKMKGTQGTLDADSLQVTESGDIVLFSGNVDMYLPPEAMANNANAAKGK
jgi:lipopolysaccharide export system protein LptC